MWAHPAKVDMKIVVSTWRDDGHIHSTGSGSIVKPIIFHHFRKRG
jgi:hypothetical protein